MSLLSDETFFKMEKSKKVVCDSGIVCRQSIMVWETDFKKYMKCNMTVINSNISLKIWFQEGSFVRDIFPVPLERKHLKDT